MLPFEISAAGATHLVFDGIQIRSVSMAGEANGVHMMSRDKHELISENLVDNVPHDTYEQQKVREASSWDMAHLTESWVKEDSQENLTDIGSSSLFREHVMDATDMECDTLLLNEVWMSDEVLTHVGGMSIFIQLDLEIPCTTGYDTEVQQCLTILMRSDHVLIVKGSYSVTPLQCPLHEKYQMWLFGKISPWRRSGFSPGQDGTYSTHHVFVKWPPWIQSCFIPRRCGQPNLRIMPPWRRGAFSPGVHVFAFITETRVCCSQVWIKVSVGDFSAVVNSALFFTTFSMEVNPDSMHIILARFDTCSVEQLSVCKCILKVGKAVVYILLNLIFQDASCLIRKLSRLLVRLMDMTWKLYNNIQTHEGSVCMRAVQSKGDNQPNRGVNSQWAVQLPGYLLLRYQCSTFVLLERTSQHMAPFTKGIAYLCSVELLVTYQSVCAFQVDLSLVDVAIAATCFELEVKLSVQLFWPSEPAIWSIISKRAPKLIAQGETETRCRASELGSYLDDSASDLAFACVIWQYQGGQSASFYQEKLVHRNQQEAGLGCYFHLPARLFGFTIFELCNMSMHDGMSWDPGGVNGSRIQAIAWVKQCFAGAVV
jgi:hypothetical protein